MHFIFLYTCINKISNTYIQNDRDALSGLRCKELLLSHRRLLLPIFPSRDAFIVAHLGDYPADKPVYSTGLSAAVSGLCSRRCLAVLSPGFGLVFAVLCPEFGLFFVEQFVDTVPAVARCLFTHPFAAERSCCALWGRSLLLYDISRSQKLTPPVTPNWSSSISAIHLAQMQKNELEKHYLHFRERRE